MRRYLLAAATARLAAAMWLGPVLLVLDRTGSASLAGLTASAALLPTLVSAPLLGAWLDATARRRAALAGNQVLLTGALGGMLAGAPVVLCAGLAGFTQPLVTGGFSSMVPALVPPERMPRAGALDSMTYNVVNVAGPALAGAIAAAAGASAAVGAQAVLALAGLAAVVTLPRTVDGERARRPLLRAGGAAPPAAAARGRRAHRAHAAAARGDADDHARPAPVGLHGRRRGRPGRRPRRGAGRRRAPARRRRRRRVARRAGRPRAAVPPQPARPRRRRDV